MPLRRNKLVASTIVRLRNQYLKQRGPDLKPRFWSNTTETKQSIIITMVLPTRGCSWALSESGGCSVCGYVNDSSRDRPIPSEHILEQIHHALNKVVPTKPIELKLFNSGSFFDENDVPRNLRLQILDLIKKTPEVILLSVESRPEYLLNQQKIIDETNRLLKPIELEIGIGLESSNSAILKDCWNKGFSIEDYKKSVEIAHSQNIRIKTYILIKPPFLTEAEAIYDSIMTTFEAVKIGTDVVSFNPCNIQNGTLVHELAKKDRYQPPWLWSILSIVQSIRNQFPDLEIICEPTAAGKRRGTHNCGKCDHKVLDLIDRVIINEKIPDDLSILCSCFLKWKVLVETPIEVFRSRNLSKLRLLNPLYE